LRREREAQESLPALAPFEDRPEPPAEVDGLALPQLAKRPQGAVQSPPRRGRKRTSPRSAPGPRLSGGCRTGAPV
jgi:hypothetical protein